MGVRFVENRSGAEASGRHGFLYGRAHVVTKSLTRGNNFRRRRLVSNEQNSPESRESRTGYGQTAYKRRLAYERLGIDPHEVQTAPFFRTNLSRIARSINQGRDERPIHPIDYLCSSEGPDALKVAKVYLAVPESYRKLLPVEAYCQAAGVSPHRVLELITGLAVRFGAEISSILTGVMLPRVVRKTIERALGDKGTPERALMFRATGFLPPRG